MVIVDSSVWLDVFAGRETDQIVALRELSPRQHLAVGDVMVCEVLQGIRDAKEFERVRKVLLSLEVLQIVDASLAVAAARNYRTLRRKGITVRGTIDCLIATFCIENGHVLLHNDRDLDAFERHLGLKVLR
jgi:hypothetical protein